MTSRDAVRRVTSEAGASSSFRRRALVIEPAPAQKVRLAKILRPMVDELEVVSALPEAPEEARVEEWVLDAYRRSWRQ